MSSAPNYPQYLNPKPDPELAEDVAFFLKWGYLVVEDALTAEQVESLRGALDETYDRRQQEFLHQLLEEDDRFAFLLDNHPVFNRMKAILGNCLQLHSATGRITTGDQDDQSWHRDGPWPIDPTGTPYGSLPGQINCGYYLDELSEENGCVVVLPGSQRVPFRPPEGYPRFPDEVRVVAKPGQAVMFDGWLYHRGAANRSGRARRGCFMCYQNAWMKSREPFDGPRVTALRENGSDEIRMLLGGVEHW